MCAVKHVVSTFALVLVAVGLLANPNPDELVKNAYADYRVCEVWRDYYYNVHTGDFVEWAGEPYVSDVCWTVPTGQPRPPHTTPDDPKEGIGNGLSNDKAEQVRKARCRQCGNGFEACKQSVAVSAGLCRNAHRAHAQDQCVKRADGDGKGGVTVRGYTFWDLLRGNRELPGFSQGSWEWGWENGRNPRTGARIRIPTGPAFGNCMRTYAEDHPSWSFSDTREASVSATVKMPPFEVGGNAGITQTSSSSWGGSSGYETACSNAAGQAVSTCVVAASECQQRYSCTPEEMNVNRVVEAGDPPPMVEIGGGIQMIEGVVLR